MVDERQGHLTRCHVNTTYLLKRTRNVGGRVMARKFVYFEKEVFRRLNSIVVFHRTVQYRKVCASGNNMPFSDTTDCNGSNSSQPVELRFAKLTENAVKPTRGSKLAAGFDLHRLINACLYHDT